MQPVRNAIASNKLICLLCWRNLLVREIVCLIEIANEINRLREPL
jgi:hypothetical protein